MSPQLTRVLFEIVLIFLLISLNGILALAEIAIVSARKSRLQVIGEAGNSRAFIALALSENPSSFLSTVQVGITLVGIVTGAIGGATLGEELGGLIGRVSWLKPYASFIGTLLTVLFITYLSLVIGELVPKRIAINNPERFACIVAYPMQILSRITSPVVSFLSRSTDRVIRLIGVKPVHEPEVTEEEIKILIEQGTRSGLIALDEKDMLYGVFRLADRRVGSLLTPRTEIVWLDLEDEPELNWQKVIESEHNYYPVARSSLDEVAGILHIKRVLEKSLKQEPLVLEELMEPPIMVPESLLALDLLEMFEKKQIHVALVLDEFGGLQGLVTLNDILKAIVGEAVVTQGFEEAEVVTREDGSWFIDGLTQVDKLKELLEVSQLPEEELVRYQTVSGLMMSRLGKIPTVGDSFIWGNYKFEVVDMDGLRVDKIWVRTTDPTGKQ
jgi:putative hemolysin